MSRLTRPKDEWECRVAGGCPMEDYILNHEGVLEDICDDCPLMPVANRLAEYDDAKEKIEDDGK